MQEETVPLDIRNFKFIYTYKINDIIEVKNYIVMFLTVFTVYI